MRLLIISDMPHHQSASGQIVGWGPTVEEIDALSLLFDEVRHIAFLHHAPAPPSALPYQSPRVKVIGVPPTGGNSMREKLGILKRFPLYLQKIRTELSQADMVHVRCPANISLLAILWLTLVRQPLRRWVKYAGNWKPTVRTPLSYSFQRVWLDLGLHRGVTTVNGRWPDQPKHVYSFHNPSLTDADIVLGKTIGEMKRLVSPIQLLFVGAVNASKGVKRVLQIAELLCQRGIPFELNILGDGPERSNYEAWTKEHSLGTHVHFRGWLPKPELSKYYAQAHFLVHPTQSDGWPKVMSESMAFGVVPLGGAVSSIPQVLAETGAGRAIPPNDIFSFVETIQEFLDKPDQWKQASRAGLASAPLFTYQAYLDSVRNLFQDAWGLEARLPELQSPYKQ